jgi:uncharacterized protein (TIGR02246 family)
MTRFTCAVVALLSVPVMVARAQQLPRGEVFFRNVEGETVGFGLSCDDRSSWKPVSLGPQQRQRYECDSQAAKMWAHVNTDIAGEPHHESELRLQNGSRYEAYFDQAARKWNFRAMVNPTTADSADTPTPVPNDESNIRNAHKLWNAAIQDRNVSGIIDLVSEDCVLLVPDNPPLVGKENIRKHYQSLFARYIDGTLQESSDIDEIQILEGAVFWRGTDKFVAAAKGAAPAQITSYEMGLMRRGIDGRWRFARRMGH